MANNNKYYSLEVFRAYQAANEHHQFLPDMNQYYDENEENNFLEQSNNILKTLRNNSQLPIQEERQQKDIDQILVAEVQSFRCLWDRSSCEYKQSQKKKLAWVKIAETLNLEGEFFPF